MWFKKLSPLAAIKSRKWNVISAFELASSLSRAYSVIFLFAKGGVNSQKFWDLIQQISLL